MRIRRRRCLPRRPEVFLPCTLALATVTLLAGPAAAPGGAAGLDEALESWLQRAFAFSAANLRDLARGRVVARTLDTSAREEVAAVAAVLVEAPADRLAAYFADVTALAREPGIHQVVRFSRPPRLDDLAALSLEPPALEALGRCRPGSCHVKLPAWAIERFQQEVDWSQPSAAVRANELFRDIVFEILQAYRREGMAGLAPYHDHSRPLDVGAVYQQLLDGLSPALAGAPEVEASFRRYPQYAGGDHVFFWSTFDFGLKPTMRVVHQSVHRGDPQGELAYAVASRQILASHYLNATVEVRLLFERPGGTLVVHASRAWSDGMTGVFGFIVRSKTRGRTRDGLDAYLTRLKQRMETADFP